jgi:integrase
MSDSKKPRHFVEKEQKGHSLFYWQPSAGLQRAGFKTVPLGKDRAAAIAGAEALNRKVDAYRGGQPVLAKNTHGTLPWLIEQYKASPGWHKVRAQTREHYETHFRRIRKWSADRGDPPMRTITKRDAEAFWASMQNTLAMAQVVIARCSQLWNYALDLDEDIVAKNPFARMNIPGPRPRDEVWKPGQIAAVIEKALAAPADKRRSGAQPVRSSIALAVLIGANTAQREGDILAMKWSQYNGKTIALTQSKTGTTLEIPVTAELKQALDEAKGASGKVVQLHQTDREICINEVTGERWLADSFIAQFRKICDAAGIPKNLQFRDLRRTATVQLAEAGCEIPEIAAFGGWSIASVHQMLKIYCPLNLTMAQSGLIKLEQYRAAGKLEG